jgi:hypothetical protein
MDQFAVVRDSDRAKEFSAWHRSRLELWNSFCQMYSVAEDSVPLFECDEDNFVQTKEIGKSRPRKVLRRSAAMEALMRKEAKTVVDDHKDGTAQYDGIIYIMHTPDSDGVIVPRYIGKSETVGKTSGVLSANLSRLESDTSKFGRWGDNYAYHIGDLSSEVLPGHEIRVKTLKYRLWAEALFETTNSQRPRLRRPVLFWVKAWRKNDIGVWNEFGPTRLSFLEYLLIGLASALFPREILNREGHNRDF